MEQTLQLACGCGNIYGQLLARPSRGARLRCYCDDCQAYARHLGSGCTDEAGGTEVVQTWPNRLRIDAARLHVLRLSPKGLLRWYAGCCNTPIANTLAGARMPFVGVLTVALGDADLDAFFGPPQGIQGRFARGGCPAGVSPSASLGIIANAVGRLARGAISRAHRPSPFFTDAGEPVVVPQVLSADERQLLSRA